MGDCVGRGLAARLRASGPQVVLTLSLCAVAAAPAAAGGDAPTTEIFTGIGVEDNSTQGYVGAGFAFGKGLYAPGWRLRAVGAFGGYDYQSALGGRSDFTFDGQDAFGAALIGYQFGASAAIFRIFAGIEGENQDITPHDPNNSVQGSAVGLRLQAESWFDLSARSFLSVDAAYGTAFQEYWSLARYGYRLRPWLAMGVEGGLLGNEEYDAGRGGGFFRFNLLATELTISGGFTGNYLESEPSGYLSAGLYRRF